MHTQTKSIDNSIHEHTFIVFYYSSLSINSGKKNKNKIKG